MKTKSNTLLFITLLGGILHTFLFWNENLALNLLIYSLFIISATVINTDIVKSRKFYLYGFMQLFAAIMVVLNNSDLSIIAYFISMLTFIGFAHYEKIRTIFVAVLAASLQIIVIPSSLIKKLSEIKIGSYSLKPVFRLTKYLILPILIVMVFTGIYSSANEVFNQYLNSFVDQFSIIFNQLFGFIFQYLSLSRLFHLCFGLLLTGGLIITFHNRSIEKAESGYLEQLFRTKRTNRNISMWYEFARTFSGQTLNRKLALKTEYITGIVSFVALNVLLFIVNTIDVFTLWFNYKPTGRFAADLHGGTNALIFSIVLAMAVILYFFRKNLNFYSKSKILRTLAYIWMIQNFILIISVLIRDGYYIEYYGLTHKRIGVMVFAVLCIVGLSTVYLKVAKQKTLFYLFKVNGNIWFMLLLVFSAANWDILIVKYNLVHKDSIVFDANYLLSLSDKALPILDQNRNVISNNEPSLNEVDRYNGSLTKLEKLDRRIEYFKYRYSTESWKSWNLPEWNAAKYFGLNK